MPYARLLMTAVYVAIAACGARTPATAMPVAATPTTTAPPAASTSADATLRCRMFRSGDTLPSATFTYRDGLLVERDGINREVFSYDEGRLVRLQQFDGQDLLSTITLEWNDVPRPTEIKVEQPGRGVVKVRLLRYDDAGRLAEFVERTFEDGTWRDAVTQSFLYSANGQLERVHEQDFDAEEPSETSFTYNDRGQHILIDNGGPLRTQYEYDENGRRNAVRLLGQNGVVNAWEFLYDERNRLNEERLTESSMSARLTARASSRYEYDEGLNENHCGFERPPEGIPEDDAFWTLAIRR